MLIILLAAAQAKLSLSKVQTLIDYGISAKCLIRPQGNFSCKQNDCEGKGLSLTVTFNGVSKNFTSSKMRVYKASHSYQDKNLSSQVIIQGKQDEGKEYVFRVVIPVKVDQSASALIDKIRSKSKDSVLISAKSDIFQHFSNFIQVYLYEIQQAQFKSVTIVFKKPLEATSSQLAKLPSYQVYPLPLRVLRTLAENRDRFKESLAVVQKKVKTEEKRKTRKGKDQKKRTRKPKKQKLLGADL